MSRSLKSEYKKKLEELRTQPKKSLGQNFLINDGVIEQILQSGSNSEIKNVIEIGPGLGALTYGLCEYAENLKLIEMDRSFAQSWREAGIEVIEQDALKVDWKTLTSGKKWMLMSNLPYQISSSIVIDRSLGPDSIVTCVFMFQKEVAERIQSDCGSKQYGILSILAQTFWQIQKVVDVSPGSFYPPPKVFSRVLKFNRIDPPSYLFDQVDRQRFLLFIKECFQQRRKMLTNNLSGMLKARTLSREQLEAKLEDLEVGAKARPEQLSVEQYHELFKWINNGN
ncbi:MAG: 16S rRNA (adenine(1518)-N(6)/adenine(1519)-N(6))-dimethyltransferase RsmA [Bdellovibrionales bacterium]